MEQERERSAIPIGAVLRAIREGKGMSQKEAAQAVGVSHQMISTIEAWPADRRLPTSAAKYASVLGFEISESIELRPRKE